MSDAADDAFIYSDGDLLDMLFSRGARRPRRPSILEDFGQPVGGTVPNIRETAEAQLQRNELERQRLLTRLALLDQFGPEDPWPDETVLTFKRDFGGPRTYIHVAVRLAGVWYVTGSRNNNRSFLWDEFVEEHLAKSLPDSIYVVKTWVTYDHVD